MAATSLRTLTYRRAVYVTKKVGLKTLEQYLRAAHKTLLNVEDRSFDLGNGIVLEGRHHKSTDGGFFLHIAGYTSGEHATVVPKKSKVSEGDLATAPPPSGAEYMDGDLVLLASDNHVVLSSGGLHEAKAEHFISLLFERAKLEHESGMFNLEKVADIKKLTILKKEGVRAIHLNTTIHQATLKHSDRTTITKKIGGRLWDELKVILGEDDRFEDIGDAENLSAKVSISFDRRKTGAVSGEAITEVARQLIKENDEGFRIETLTGDRLSATDVVLRKIVSLPRYAKTVQYNDVWKELQTYIEELKESGSLEQ